MHVPSLVSKYTGKIDLPQLTNFKQFDWSSHNMTRDRASKIEHCSIYKYRDASRRIATLCDASQRIQCSHSLLFAYVLKKSTRRAVTRRNATRRNACSVAGPLT